MSDQPTGEVQLTRLDIQRRVWEWHQKIFSGRRPLTTAKKILEEASELHVEAKKEPLDIGALSEEIADVVIACYALASMVEVELEPSIDAKLAILLARKLTQKERDRERGIED